MRNLLETSSVAQRLDGDRLTGRLHIPVELEASPIDSPRQEPSRHDTKTSIVVRTSDSI